MIGNGVVCTTTDPCSPNPCYAGTNCTLVANSSSGFECGPCPQDLHGNGQECYDDPCEDLNPCFTGVRCRSLQGQGQVECDECPPGMVGDGWMCKGKEGVYICTEELTLIGHSLAVSLYLSNGYSSQVFYV